MFYSDFQVALCWIKGVTKQWKQFVENCIQEIRRLVPVNYWKHCHSGDNPWIFHLGGSGLESLQSKKIWWNGPSWLTGTRDTEAVGNVSEEEIEKCSLERKKDSQVTYLLVNEENIRIGMIVKIQRFMLLIFNLPKHPGLFLIPRFSSLSRFY